MKSIMDVARVLEATALRSISLLLNYLIGVVVNCRFVLEVQIVALRVLVGA